MNQRYIFFDRDGTLNDDRGYVTNPKDLSLLPGAASAVHRLRKLGYQIIVVTNQSAIGRGVASQEDVASTNEELCRQLFAEHSRAVIDHIFVCPHRPEDECMCRKPKTGMVTDFLIGAPAEIELSFLVGDKLSDVQFGYNLGLPHAHVILVLTGHGKKELEIARSTWATLPAVAENVEQAARMIESMSKGGK